MAIRSNRYTVTAMILHWLIAAAILFQIVLGWRMGGDNSPETYALFQLHKSIGITILLLSLLRLGWRILNPPPAAPEGQPRLERLAAGAVHVTFYVVMLGLPLTGWILVSASRIQIPTILFGVVPWPHLPLIPELAPAAKAVWEQIGAVGHDLLVKLTYLLLALHLGAVAKHQLLDRDTVFSRMAANARPGLREPRFWVALTAMSAVIGLAWVYSPSMTSPARDDSHPVAGEQIAGIDEGAEAGRQAPDAENESPAQASEAVPPPASDEGAVPARPRKWRANTSQGRLGFTTAWSGEVIEGRLSKWDADILFSPDALEASRLSVRIDMSSVQTGDSQRDASLASSDFFDLGHHPVATFNAASFRRTGPERYVASGVLSLRGVSRPLSLPFHLKIEDDVATARGSADLDRTVFGVGQGPYSSVEEIPALVRVTFAFTAQAAD